VQEWCPCLVDVEFCKCGLEDFVVVDEVILVLSIEVNLNPKALQSAASIQPNADFETETAVRNVVKCS
jgi:hypothetical protein